MTTVVGLPQGSLSRLTEDEARAVTDELKADAERLWGTLLWLYEAGAHTALGYGSWADYCSAEFKMGKSQAYRLLDAARVVGELPHGGMRPANERVARELAAADDPAEAWGEVVDRHGDRPTAAETREVVREREGAGGSRTEGSAPARGSVTAAAGPVGSRLCPACLPVRTAPPTSRSRSSRRSAPGSRRRAARRSGCWPRRSAGLPAT
jgi:hypothetical protein